MDMHEAICRALFAANFGNAYGGPDGPYVPGWCDPNGCKGRTHAEHKDALAWFSCDQEATDFVRKLSEFGYEVRLAKADEEKANG